MTSDFTSVCDTYLESRTGHYDYRALRYRAAAQEMVNHTLSDDMTVFDIGAGMTEFDYCLRVEYNWRGRYIPVDGGIDGTDLNMWRPPREAHWFVALEIIEHLHQWKNLIYRMQQKAIKGIIVSTPNPETTDVIGMDSTHVCEVHARELESLGFKVKQRMFYGGVYSKGLPDNLFGVWTRD